MDILCSPVMQEFGQDLLVALFCVGVGGMDATGSACRVLVGIKLKSRKTFFLTRRYSIFFVVVLLRLLFVILLSFFLFWCVYKTKSSYRKIGILEVGIERGEPDVK